MANYPRTWTEIKLENIQHNVRVIRQLLSPGCLFMAVVKADGYGHGAVEVAKAALAAGADRLGIATVEEGRQLREAGIEAPMHLLTGFYPGQAQVISELDLIPAIFTDEQLNELKNLNKPLAINIKVDTGMSRLGLNVKQAPDFIEKVRQNKNLQIEGLFTHFATADEVGSPFAEQQLKEFNTLLENLAKQGYLFKVNHAANSAAAILNPASQLQMVRVGIALYGLHPSGATKDRIDLKPALSWYSKLSLVKEVKAGLSVSYGATYAAQKTEVIGTVPVGYADGYSRRLSNNTDVLIRGEKVKQIGRICMDQMMVRLDQVQTQVGEKVILIGKEANTEISADDLASKLGTINYEIVCGIAARVPRHYEHI